VALTANAVYGMREMFLQIGFDDFMSKPIDFIEMDTILKKWIPKEKQISSAVACRNFANTNNPTMTTFSIEGVDVNKGIRLSGEKFEYYYEILTMFHNDALKQQEKIKKYLDTGDLHMYTIHIHALKSALANIGADELSEAAHALEMAGQRGDLPFIETNTEHFNMMLEQLVNSISNALPSSNVKGEGDPLINEQFIAELAKLKTALENLDFEVVNRTNYVLTELAWTDDIKTVVRNISKHILLFEYDEASALIDDLLRETVQ